MLSECWVTPEKPDKANLAGPFAGILIKKKSNVPRLFLTVLLVQNAREATGLSHKM